MGERGKRGGRDRGGRREGESKLKGIAQDECLYVVDFSLLLFLLSS